MSPNVVAFHWQDAWKENLNVFSLIIPFFHPEGGAEWGNTVKSAGTGSQVMKVEHTSDNVSVTVKRDRKKGEEMEGDERWMDRRDRQMEWDGINGGTPVL